MTVAPFPKFPKTTRVSKDVVFTEKVDGTNGLIYIQDANTEDARVMPGYDSFVSTTYGDYFIRAGSRTRWIAPDMKKLDGTVQRDNFGFARWVREHAEDLASLGPGHHYGEWFGKGIQRGYGIEDKRFALFNVGRFRDPSHVNYDPAFTELGYGVNICPAVATTVPVLAVVPYAEITTYLDLIEAGMVGAGYGSALVNGYNRPEGVMIYDTATRIYKKHIFGSTGPKGMEPVK